MNIFPSRALVASDLNPKYLDFWPVVKKSWNEIIGIPVTLILIADEIPEHLKNDDSIILFKPLPNMYTAFQAQCIRNLYPALLKNENGSVIISDMDMIPLDKKYFMKQMNETSFHVYRGIHPHIQQIWMCYCAATPAVWSKLFSCSNIEDVHNILNDWYKDSNYDNNRGSGWCTDQLQLYKHVMKVNLKIQIETDEQMNFRHLDRIIPHEWLYLNETLQKQLQTNVFTDFHMPDYQKYKDIIHQILEFCILINKE